MAHLFTSQSIFRSHHFSIIKNDINNLLDAIDTQRYAGTKHNKSGNQPYTIIDGAQGNRYELLTHLTQAEADALGSGHFFDPLRQKIFVGGGASKKIRLARNMATHEIVIVGKSLLYNDESLKGFTRKVENHLALKDTSILKLQDQAIITIDDGIEKGYTFMSLGKECGDTTVTRLQHLSESENQTTSDISLNLIKGLAEFESKGVIHGDIKPLNFIIDDTGMAHWIDFGTGRDADAMKASDYLTQLNQPRTPICTKRFTSRGPRWLSPRIIHPQKRPLGTRHYAHAIMDRKGTL